MLQIQQPTLNVHALKTIIEDTQIGDYRLSPHFLVKIFSIGQREKSVQYFLSTRQPSFYDSRRDERLRIAASSGFFDLLDSDIQTSLLQEPKDHVAQLQAILTNVPLTQDDIEEIREHASYSEFLHGMIRYHGNDVAADSISRNQVPQWLTALRDGCNILNQKSAYDKYQDYVKSEYVREESERGTCIDIARNRGQGYDYQQSPKAQTEQGHWKLHIHINMNQKADGTPENSQSQFDAAYDILLEEAIRYGINQLKLVAPFKNIHSMENRELTIYLRSQNPNEPNVQQFIAQVESRFLARGIIAEPNTEIANRKLAGSSYFSFRNEMDVSGTYLSASDAESLATTYNSSPHNPLNHTDAFKLEHLDLKIRRKAQLTAQRLVAMQLALNTTENTPTGPNVNAQPPILHQQQLVQQPQQLTHHYEHQKQPRKP